MKKLLLLVGLVVFLMSSIEYVNAAPICPFQNFNFGKDKQWEIDALSSKCRKEYYKKRKQLKKELKEMGKRGEAMGNVLSTSIIKKNTDTTAINPMCLEENILEELRKRVCDNLPNINSWNRRNQTRNDQGRSDDNKGNQQQNNQNAQQQNNNQQNNSNANQGFPKSGYQKWVEKWGWTQN